MIEKVKEALGGLAAFALLIGLPIGVGLLSNSSDTSKSTLDSVSASASEPECRTETIDFERVEEDSDDLYVGDYEVTTEGVDGKREICETDGIEVSNTVVNEPVNEITSIGTLEEEYDYYDYNDAGCPKNQYVNGYYRANGTYVQGYYRNSPNDDCY